MAISDRENRQALAQVLVACGLEPILCSTIGEVRAILASETTGVVFCDIAFADGSFAGFPRAISRELRAPVIVCSRLYDPAVYLDVMYRGAFDFIVYPYPADEVRGILDRAFRRSSECAPKPSVNSERATTA